MTAPEELTCAVCGEAVEDVVWLSECLQCGRWYHLNPYSNRPGKDCGDAIVGDTAGVETYCNDCIHAQLGDRAPTSEKARAEAMMRGLYGEGMQMPPQVSPPAGRRRFRRMEDE